MKYYLKLLSVPLLLLGLYLSLNLIWYLFSLPPAGELQEIVEGWFATYGTPALFFSSLLEGLLLVGSYFPGVLVIFLGVLVADSVSGAVFSVGVSTVGLILAHILNYFLGKYGWYKLLVRFGMKEAINQSKLKLEKQGLIALPLSYWLPSMAALTNTAAGIIGLPFKKFLLYSVLSSIFWYSLAGFMVYPMGDSALDIAIGGSGQSVLFLIILIWISILLISDYRERKRLRINLKQL